MLLEKYAVDFSRTIDLGGGRQGRHRFRCTVYFDYDYLAICDHTPNVGAVPGLTADDVLRQGEEIAAANEALAPTKRYARAR